jgi:hypothetical protein
MPEVIFPKVMEIFFFHIPRKGKGDISEEGKNYWKTKISAWTIHSYSKDATNPERGRS